MLKIPSWASSADRLRLLDALIFNSQWLPKISSRHARKEEHREHAGDVTFQ